MDSGELINELHKTDCRIAELRHEPKSAENRAEIKRLKAEAIRLDHAIAESMDRDRIRTIELPENSDGVSVRVTWNEKHKPGNRRLRITRPHPTQKRRWAYPFTAKCPKCNKGCVWETGTEFDTCSRSQCGFTAQHWPDDRPKTFDEYEDLLQSELVYQEVELFYKGVGREQAKVLSYWEVGRAGTIRR